MTQMTVPKALVISPLPPPYGGLGNNMKLYLSSSLVNDYNVSCLNLSAGLKREKNPDKPSLFTAVYSVFVLGRLIYLLVKISPELVYMKAGSKWGFIRDMFIIMICKLFRKKLICHLHSKSSDTLFLDHSSMRVLFRWCMRFPDKVIVLSENLKSEFTGLISNEKLVAIENIVDTSLFNDIKEKRRLKDSYAQKEQITILFIGRLSKSKGIWDLLESIQLIVARAKKVKFVLAGLTENEDEEVKIKAYCAKPPFNNHVVFPGIIDGKRKSKALLNADIFVLPTRNDNTPNAILEAFAAGLPVVSTKVGQIPYMLEDGINGYIVEPGDRKQLVEKLLLLIESPLLRARIGRSNYKKVRETHAIEVGAKKMKKVFDSLL